jgi:hypothetical protein
VAVTAGDHRTVCSPQSAAADRRPRFRGVAPAPPDDLAPRRDADCGHRSRRRQIREADETIERANADLDDTIRQLGELDLLGRPASQETLQKLTTALDDAHITRARLGDGGESNVIGPDDIDKLSEPAKRLAAWRRLITTPLSQLRSRRR